MAIDFVVAEDNDLLRKTIAQLLESQNGLYTCVGQAKDGAEALELVEQHEPHLLILDLRMPEMDGFDVMKALNQGPFKPYILVLTIENSKDMMRKALDFGADGYCMKTSRRDELLEAVYKVSNGKRFTCADSI